MKTHDYVHYYRGYWSDGGKCRIRVYQEDGLPPVVTCSQVPDNSNTSVTNMAEYLAAEVGGGNMLPPSLRQSTTPSTATRRIEHAAEAFELEDGDVFS
jgi:hypothetical protein